MVSGVDSPKGKDKTSAQPSAEPESEPPTPKRRTRVRNKRAIFTRVESVAINSLVPFHKNPRRGNVDAIAESLRENGQFQPLVVNKGTKTGRTNEILAGNHTWKAAKQLKWLKVGVVYVDVDDDEAKRIMLAANRTNDLSSYDAELLADILDSIPDVTGTGYSEPDAKAIIDSVKQQEMAAVEAVVRPKVDLTQGLPDPFDDTDDVDDTMGGPIDMELSPDIHKDMSEQISGIVQLTDEMDYDYEGDWDIPHLRDDLLVRPGDLPDKLAAWAGSATKYDPVKDWPEEDQWWLYNYGIDSTAGMRDISKVIVSFFCWDDYFVGWWTYPGRYVSKLLNSGIQMAVTPDFSQWRNEPRVVSLWSFYKTMWMGRYFQEAGISVIPNLVWRFGDHEWLKQVILPHMPKKVPVMALGLEFFQMENQDELDSLATTVKLACDTCKVEVLLVYGSERAKEVADTFNIKAEVRWVESRLKALGDKARLRQKRVTL